MQILFFLNEVYMPLEVKSRHWSFSGAATLAGCQDTSLWAKILLMLYINCLMRCNQPAGILLVILSLGETGTQL